MTPENVPDELLSLYGRNHEGRSAVEAKRRALAAVLTEHERLVREQVATEIESAHGPDRRFPSGWASFEDRDHAARIARGESR